MRHFEHAKARHDQGRGGHEPIFSAKSPFSHRNLSWLIAYGRLLDVSTNPQQRRLVVVVP